MQFKILNRLTAAVILISLSLAIVLAFFRAS